MYVYIHMYIYKYKIYNHLIAMSGVTGYYEK